MKNIISTLTMKELEQITYRALQESFSQVMVQTLRELDEGIALGRDERVINSSISGNVKKVNDKSIMSKIIPARCNPLRPIPIDNEVVPGRIELISGN